MPSRDLNLLNADARIRFQPSDFVRRNVADTLFQQYFRTGATRRTLGYSNPKLDEILETQQLTFDVKKREKLLWEAHKIILEDAPAVPLWNAMDIYTYRARLVWKAPPDERYR